MQLLATDFFKYVWSWTAHVKWLIPENDWLLKAAIQKCSTVEIFVTKFSKRQLWMNLLLGKLLTISLRSYTDKDYKIHKLIRL